MANAPKSQKWQIMTFMNEILAKNHAKLKIYFFCLQKNRHVNQSLNKQNILLHIYSVYFERILIFLIEHKCVESWFTVHHT